MAHNQYFGWFGQRTQRCAGPLCPHGNLIVYPREHPSGGLLVALNLDGQPAEVSISGSKLAGRLLLSSLGDRVGEALSATVALQGHEGVIYELGQS